MVSGKALNKRTVSPPVGRGAETGRLELVIGSVGTGIKRGVLLLGGAGIGKTTLLRWACDRAGEAGLLCAHVRAPAVAGLPPRFPIGELLEGLIEACEGRGVSVPGSIRRVRDTVRGATSVEDYPADLPQIAQAIEDVGELSPIGIFVDDYQWVPAEANELLIGVLRAVECPVLFVGAARTPGGGEEALPSLPEPSADLWVEHLEVEGLDEEGVSALAEATLGKPVLPTLGRLLHEQTLGNPLFVIETLRQWMEDGVLVTVGGYWSLPEGRKQSMPRSLQEVVRARLGALGTEAALVTQALATLGRPARFDELRDITASEPDSLVETLSDLTRQRILIADTDAEHHYRIAHPLYESAALQHLGSTRTAALHGAIYEILEMREKTHPIPAAELAHHAVNALVSPPRLPDLLGTAAAEAEAAGSYIEAARWYEHLARVTPNEPPVLAGLLEAQASATSHFDPRKATDIFTTALALVDSPSDRTRLLAGRAYAHRVAGSLDDALADLETAARIAPSEEVFGIKHAVAALLGAKGEVERAEGMLRTLVKEATNPSDEAKALGHLGQALLSKGDLQGAKDLWIRVLQSPVQEGYKHYIRCNLTWAYILLGEWLDAERFLKESMRAASEAGDVWNLQTLLGMAGRFFAWKGELTDALDYATRAMQLAARLDNPASYLDASVSLILTLMEMNSIDEAVKVATEAHSYTSNEVESRELSSIYSILGNAHLKAGDTKTAQKFHEMASKNLPNATCWTTTVDRLEIEILEATGDMSGALHLVEQCSQAEILLPFEAGMLDEVAARILMKAGRKEQAMQRAESALGQYTMLNASLRSTRVRQWIDAHRARVRGRPRSSALGGLTERELEVLSMVAAGKTNREIAEELVLSVATVKKHIENIRTKAATTTRADLRSLFERLQDA